MYDTLEEFYLAEALEYIDGLAAIDAPTTRSASAARSARPSSLPLVARLVNELDLDLRHAHFWGMDEWVDATASRCRSTHPLTFAKADRELCFNRIRPELRMPDANLHFPTGDLAAYIAELRRRSAAR